jgi:hypothetical protein
MNTYSKKIFFILLVPILILSCTKQVGPLDDVRPKVPVTVQNAMDYRPEPTVSTSVSGGGSIQIILTIPSSSGRTIKEITKVAASTSYTQIQSSGSTGFYTSAPIAATGTTVTFTTSLTEYISKAGGTVPAANNELAKKFYFLVTLDDNSVIVTDAVRVLVLS